MGRLENAIPRNQNEVDVTSINDLPDYQIRNNMLTENLNNNLLIPSLGLQNKIDLSPKVDNSALDQVKTELNALRQLVVAQLYQQKQESDHRMLLLENKMLEQDKLLKELGRRYEELLLALTPPQGLLKH